MELLAAGTWSGAGVLGSEAFDAVPFLDLVAEYGSPHAVEERDPAHPLLIARRVGGRGASVCGAQRASLASAPAA